MAVGFAYPSGTRVAAAVWTSPDGSVWSRVPHDEAVFGRDRPQSMKSVTAFGSGLVAVGMIDQRPAVWISPNGLAWSLVPDNPEAFAREGLPDVEGVTVGGPGLVAVGRDDNSAAVWTSPDGITWSRVPHDMEVFGGEGVQGMVSVTPAGQGLVAVGYDHSSSNDPALWTSPDGVAWFRVPPDELVFPGPGGTKMNSVTVGPDGLVAVGWDGQSPAVWTSEEGGAWWLTSHAESAFGTKDTLDGVTAIGPGLVAVGSAASGRNLHAAAWVTGLTGDNTT